MSNPRDSGVGDLRRSVSSDPVSPPKFRPRSLSLVEQQQRSDSESDSEDSDPKSFDSSESESQNSFASIEEEMAPPVTIKTNVELPVYFLDH